MEVQIIDYQNEREKINAPYGIKVEDGEGNEYTVSLNKFGELDILHSRAYRLLA